MTFTHSVVRSWVRSLWIGALGGVVLGLLGGAALVLAISEAPPVTVRDAREVDGIAHRGGRLDLLFTIDQTRDCPVTTSRYLWRWLKVDDVLIRQFVPLDTSSNALPLIDEANRIVLSLQLPPELPEGEWFYWSRSIDHCRSFFNFFDPSIRQTTNIPVRIVNNLLGMTEVRP